MRALFTFAASCLFLSSLSAEFQQIQVRWTPGLCGEDCINNLRREFAKIPGFQEAEFGPSQVDLKWKPNFPFTFQSINAATRMVGIRLQDVRIRVRGHVSRRDAHTFFLTSEGDNTRVILIGSAPPEPTGYTVVQNVETHALSPDVQEKLEEAAANKTAVVVDGPLFMPFQMPSLRLVVDQLKVEKKQEPPSHGTHTQQPIIPNKPQPAITPTGTPTHG